MLIQTSIEGIFKGSMDTAMQPWETRLLDLAYQGLEQQRNPAQPVSIPATALEQAYAYCEEITRSHSKTFYLSSGLMPLEKRRAIRALYAFCRITDDTVDRGEGDILALLESWRAQSLDERPDPANLAALAWHDTRNRFGIPRAYAEQLIRGVEQDMHQVRYQCFDDLAVYGYAVASTVGLMSMHIIGYETNAAIPYAIRLGVALQLTNILRDVGEDWRMGRLYLPSDELRAFAISEEDIAAGEVTTRWRDFMRFQINRARELYRTSLPGVRLLHADGRFAVAAAGELYQRILDDIEAHDYDVFNRRAYIPQLTKMRHMPGIWWRSRFNGYSA